MDILKRIQHRIGNANRAAISIASTVDIRPIVDLLLTIRGRAVFTGIGKSAQIASYAANVFNTLHIPALYIQAAEFLHGQTGAMLIDDVLVAISKSGNTPEIIAALRHVRESRPHVHIVLITSQAFTEARAAPYADVHVHIPIRNEGCPLGLTPYATTTATKIVLDIVASTIATIRGFSYHDAALTHPAGTVGEAARELTADPPETVT